MASVTKHTRKAILNGRVPGAPERCGATQRNGKACGHLPIYQSQWGFSCGKHKKRLEQPPPPPKDERFECPICYDKHDKTDTVTTECNHQFCKACLDKWEGCTCPLCRHILSGREHRSLARTLHAEFMAVSNSNPSMLEIVWRRMVAERQVEIIPNRPLVR